MTIKFYDKDFSLEVGQGKNGICFDINDKDGENLYAGGCVTIPFEEIDDLINFLNNIREKHNGKTD